MNGVRRFLGGGATTPTTPTSLPPEPSTPTTTPLFLVPKGPSWPPPSATSSDSPPVTPSDSPKMTTAALFLRKDKQKSRPQPLEEGHTNGTNGHSPMNSISSFGSPLNSPSPNGRSSSPTRRDSSSAMSPSPRGPPPQRVSQLSRKPPGDRASTSSEGKRPTSMIGNVRDDLLMSLLASEAIVESREYKIMSSEEIEELKKEQLVLQSRLSGVAQKLSLETKVRDAALSLSKANAAYKTVSKQSTEQLEACDRKVDLLQKEFWRVSERASEIHRRLLEHRASVLSYSVRSLEKKAAGDSDSDLSLTASGYSTPNRSMPVSPASTSATSVISSPSKGRFDGAHFFAGHSEAVIPQLSTPQPSGVPPQAMIELEEKLAVAQATLEEANAKRGELSRELSLLRLEKDQIETTLGMEVQTAEDTIRALEREAERLGSASAQVKTLEEERESWKLDRAELDQRRREVDSLERRLEVLEERCALTGDIEEKLETEREKYSVELEKREGELEEAKIMWEADKTAWEVERVTMEQELDELQAARKREAVSGGESSAQLSSCFKAVQDVMQANNISIPREQNLPAFIASITAHLDMLESKLQANAQAEKEWSILRAKLEADVRAGFDKHEELSNELEKARKEREDTKNEVQSLQAGLQAAALAAASSASVAGQSTVEYTGDSAAIVAILKPIWVTLPSPEARASKMGTGARFRAGSPTTSPVGTKPGSSLSEMDVRSLKQLYDPRGLPALGSAGGLSFTIEAFAERVQALIADDRALIERLIRFAQAHDLLKKNAERAQKLALDSNGALETYQKQVKILEDHNIVLTARQASMQDEIQRLQEAVDRITADKLEMETHAAEQAETCAQLTDANKVLSARALTLAQDAATSTDGARKQYETQLAELNTSLSATKAELESVRQSQQASQMAMMEELNSIQTENDSLRSQLRAKK